MAWKYEAAMAHVDAINKLKKDYGHKGRLVYQESEGEGIVYYMAENDVLQMMVERFRGTRARCMDWVRGYERGIRDHQDRVDEVVQEAVVRWHQTVEKGV